LAEVSRANDFSTTYLVRTHLGYILKPGDHVKGYLIANSNFNQQEFDNLLQKGKEMPDIVLVRKSYPNARRKTRKRNWKLKNLVKEEDIELRKDRQRTERDYEAFLRDIEEDVELRGMINLYKDAQDDQSNDNAMEDSGDETEEDFPEIDIEELLEDVEQMKLDE
jgi:nonsense-mediated mRNA decay protein 3